MAYHTYSTEAFILHAFPRGEDSRVFVLYTRELGLRYALARGVRSSGAKLKSILQVFSHASVTLVYGRELWRITGARELNHFYYDTLAHPHAHEVFLRLSMLLRRLIHGEEADPELFDLLTAGFVRLSRMESEADTLAIFECILALRLLQKLGYVGALPHLASVMEGLLPSPEALRGLTLNRRALVVHINEALKATQL
jgi:DNA repair protein RecO